MEKVIGQTKEKIDLRLARASIDIDKPAKAVFDLIWDVNGYKVRLSRAHARFTLNSILALGRSYRF